MFRLIILLISWIGTFSLAASKPLDLSPFPAKRIITVTGHPDYAPYIWKSSKTGDLTGLTVEMLRQVLRSAGIQMKTVPVDTWGRAQKEVEDGQVDLLLPPYRNEERLAYFAYPAEPMLIDKSVIFVKKGHAFKFEKRTDLVGKTGVAIIADSFGNDFDRLNREKLKMNRLTTTAQCFSYILKDRADFMVAGSSAGRAVAAQLKILSEIEILKNPVIETGMYVAISKKSAWNRNELRTYLGREFKKMRTSGALPKMEEKYLIEFSNEQSRHAIDGQSTMTIEQTENKK